MPLTPDQIVEEVRRWPQDRVTELLDRLVDLMVRREHEAAEVPASKEGRRTQWARQVRAWFGLN